MLKYCYDRYKPIEMCKKSVDGFLPAIKFVPDWFKKLRTALFADDDILFVDEDSRNVTFSSDEMDILGYRS